MPTIRKAVVKLVAGVLCAGLALPVQAAPCASKSDWEALRTRIALSALMVDAINCNEQGRYNTVATHFKVPLARDGRQMQAYFRRVHGRQATEQMNSFVTEVANKSSIRTAERTQSYCQDVQAKFDDMASRKTTEWHTIAAAYAADDLGSIKQCRTAPQRAHAPAQKKLPVKRTAERKRSVGTQIAQGHR